MPFGEPLDVGRMVEPDRVHRACYVDDDVFAREMEYIHHKTWIYVGHDSQIPEPGDFYTTMVGQQPMIMIRAKDGEVHVLYNRCPHRGTRLCSARHGHVEDVIRCSYHAWQFHFDGSVESVPMAKGYEGTRLDPHAPEFRVKRPAKVESYRGFVFASLGGDVPDLQTFLGGAVAAFDDMCDRAPEGEVEVVPNCFRMIQKSNWKIFLENQLDGSHPAATHESTGWAAANVEREIEARTGEKAPLSYHFLSAFMVPIEKFDEPCTVGHPHGHCILEGYMALRPQDPDSLAYEEIMRKSYGEERMEEILGVNIHHVLVYPSLSVQSPLQQLRAVRPLAPDRTLTEIWHFRLKGAPEAIYRRSLDYYYLVNSPSTMVNADDLYNFRKVHEGLRTQGGDWVSFHRNAGQDHEENGVVRSITGMSEVPMRNMYKAWASYMSSGDGR